LQVEGGLVEVDEGEHFAADGFVADPEDEVGAPLHGFGYVGEGEEIGAEALGVHAWTVTGAGTGHKRRLNTDCTGGTDIGASAVLCAPVAGDGGGVGGVDSPARRKHR
jgi:hypothetical protein